MNTEHSTSNEKQETEDGGTPVEYPHVPSAGATGQAGINA